MIALVSPALLLALSTFGLHPIAFTARTSGCYDLPANLHAAPELRPSIRQLLARSPTLRRQCERIAAARNTQVTIAITLATISDQARARSTARRYDSRLLIIDVEIPPASAEFAELLAHELEHATEIIERVDFRRLARQRGGQTEQRGDGTFETERARQAGRAAAAEAHVSDPTVATVSHGLARAADATRSLVQRLPFR